MPRKLKYGDGGVRTDAPGTVCFAGAVGWILSCVGPTFHRLFHAIHFPVSSPPLHHSTLLSPKYLKKPSPPLADDRIPSATSLLMESWPMARALSRRRVSALVRSPAPPRSCSPRRLLDLGHPVCPGSKSTAMPVDFSISVWEKWGNL